VQKRDQPVTPARARLCERFGVHSLRLFGSWARGQQHRSSDVDLLVAFTALPTARTFYGLQLFREDLLPATCRSVTEQAPGRSSDLQ